MGSQIAWRTLFQWVLAAKHPASGALFWLGLVISKKFSGGKLGIK